MLIGRYEHTLDAKGRFTLPSELGAELAGGVVLTSGIEGCIYLFSRGEFERMSQRMESLPFTDSKARKLWRRFFPHAHAAEPDRQRRVLIPQWLREHANITDKVVIAGMYRYVEIWEPAAWRAHEQALEQELADEDYFASLNV